LGDLEILFQDNPPSGAVGFNAAVKVDQGMEASVGAQFVVIAVAAVSPRALDGDGRVAVILPLVEDFDDSMFFLAKAKARWIAAGGSLQHGDGLAQEALFASAVR